MGNSPGMPRRAIPAILLLAACTPHTPPTIAAQTDQNLVLFRQGRHTLQESFTYAETFCRARGRVSVHQRTERVDPDSVLDHFECRSRPNSA